MGCGCKKNSTQQTTQQQPVKTSQDLQNQIKVVVNKYNKLKK